MLVPGSHEVYREPGTQIALWCRKGHLDDSKSPENAKGTYGDIDMVRGGLSTRPRHTRVVRHLFQFAIIDASPSCTGSRCHI